MKKVISLIMSVCFIFTMFACVSSAASVEVESSLPAIIRLCPGTVIGEATEDILPTPEVYGAVYSEGWEIKVEGGDWVPYQGEPLELTDDGAKIRYFAITFSNDIKDYAYSNECDLIVKHNPTGSYLYSGTEHWRVCADCGGQSDVELHDHFEEPKAGNTVCGVCGAKRTSQWTGLAAFFDWLLATIIGMIM
ncbi:MAG: hypothetical protein IIV47_01460 [Clostridia bacterium]|nr:hypothetical protein [Clostridia bacterium]